MYIVLSKKILIFAINDMLILTLGMLSDVLSTDNNNVNEMSRISII